MIDKADKDDDKACMENSPYRSRRRSQTDAPSAAALAGRVSSGLPTAQDVTTIASATASNLEDCDGLPEFVRRITVLTRSEPGGRYASSTKAFQSKLRVS